MKPLSRTPRALARRLKTPICKACSRPKLAETSHIPGQRKTFSFTCWTPGCPEGEMKTWAKLKESEVIRKEVTHETVDGPSLISSRSLFD
ncbi:MAG: hypothetical protein NTX59_08320 [Elusimicrobia bacterium]|nr:hypothetical protein [Elusimicrobiota bacterium]